MFLYHKWLVIASERYKNVKNIRIIDLEKCLTEKNLSEFMICSDNNNEDASGIKYSSVFNDIKIHIYSRSLLFLNTFGFLAVTAISKIVMTETPIGVLLKLSTETGNCLNVVCR